jgi:hypothetical protein
MFLAAAAVIGGVILFAVGRGGEMAAFPADYPPLALEQVTAADVALLQPPRSLWGYNPQLTEEALQAIARAVSERDVEIERLRAEVASLRPAVAAAEPGEQPVNGRAAERAADD